MQFSEFNLIQPLQKAIHKMQFEAATPIQEQAIPPGLVGRDIIGCAQTGTGKTIAFLLPILQRLFEDKSKPKYPRAIILAPTRELVIQVTEQARRLAAGIDCRIAAIYGGARMKHQTSRLRRGTDIIVATPGRLQDHIRRNNVGFQALQILVLDEADRMLDMGFLPDIRQIVNKMPSERQTLLFSATMPVSVLHLTQQFQRDPLMIEISLARPPETIQQTLYPVHKHLKIQLLLALLDQMTVESMLVFTATKQEADIVTRKLKQANISVACIHSDFKQRERVAALEGFRSGKYQVLVATNIAARGLDIEGISHVINYDVPDHPQDYVHRIGRTARAQADGDALTLVTPDEEGMIHRIEYLLGYKIERAILPRFDYDIPIPSWAQPSAAAIIRQSSKPKSLADHWRGMSRGGGRRR